MENKDYDVSSRPAQQFHALGDSKKRFEAKEADLQGRLVKYFDSSKLVNTQEETNQPLPQSTEKEQEVSQGIISRFSQKVISTINPLNYLTAEGVANTGGNLYGQVYGQQMTNALVAKASGFVLNAVFGPYGARALLGTVQSTLTPILMGYAPGFIGGAAGLGVTGLFGVGSYIISKLTPSEKEAIANNTMPIEEVKKLLSHKVDSNRSTIDRIMKLTYERDIYAALKEKTSREEVADYLNSLVIYRTDGNIVYANGTMLTEKEKIAFERLINTLKSTQTGDTIELLDDKELQKPISRIAENLANSAQSGNVVSILMEVENSEVKEVQLIKCSDKNYCLADGTFIEEQEGIGLLNAHLKFLAINAEVAELDKDNEALREELEKMKKQNAKFQLTKEFETVDRVTKEDLDEFELLKKDEAQFGVDRIEEFEDESMVYIDKEADPKVLKLFKYEKKLANALLREDASEALLQKQKELQLEEIKKALQEEVKGTFAPDFHARMQEEVKSDARTKAMRENTILKRQIAEAKIEQQKIEAGGIPTWIEGKERAPEIKQNDLATSIRIENYKEPEVNINKVNTQEEVPEGEGLEEVPEGEVPEGEVFYDVSLDDEEEENTERKTTEADRPSRLVSKKPLPKAGMLNSLSLEEKQDELKAQPEVKIQKEEKEKVKEE